MRKVDLRMYEQRKFEVIKDVVNARKSKSRAEVELDLSRRQIDRLVIKEDIRSSLFESIETLGHAAQTLTDNCILGITANEKHCKDLVNASAGIATALCPSIGYAASAALAKESLKTDVPVRELAIAKGYVTTEEADKLLDPYTMTGKRYAKVDYYASRKAVTQG